MHFRELLLEPLAFMAPGRILGDLTDEQAAARLTGAPHSIHEIVAHLGFWQSWFLQRCRGEAIPPAASAALGWPGAVEGTWATVRDQFLVGLDQAVAFADQHEDLNQPVAPAIEFPPLAKYTLREALAHVATHNAHHLGQIVTLRQLMGLWPPPGGSFTW